MPLTYSGRLVDVGVDHPSLLDIAIGLSRMPRFAGQTKRWWSVLDHTLFCDELLLADLGSCEDRSWRLGILLHDAHEALTADVPTPLKNDGLRATQRSLDEAIMAAFFPGGYLEYRQGHRNIAAIDNRALLAEAQVVGAPVPRKRIIELFGGASEQTTLDVERLESLLKFGWVGHPPMMTMQDYHPAVQEYLRRVLHLM